jgi:hypothetical protein
MIFTTRRASHLVHFLDNLLSAGMALVVQHQIYTPPLVQLRPQRRRTA